MKKYKIIKLLLSLFIVSIAVTACSHGTVIEKKVEIRKNDNNIDIDKKNVGALKIEDTVINGITQGISKDKLKRTKVENNSLFNVSNIKVIYSEYDQNGNIISNDSNTVLEMTLLPGESAYLQFANKEFTKTIKIDSYNYTAEGKRVRYNLKKKSYKIKKLIHHIENSKPYEALFVSKFKLMHESSDGNSYRLKIKNSSSKDLNNLVLKIAEIDKNGNYILLDHRAYDGILKASQEDVVDIISSKDTKELEVVGYTYNDTETNSNINIDLKSQSAIKE